MITLGIIGVVAALTMPTLIANIRDKSLESAYKKAQSSLINGYKLLMGKESIIDVKNLEMMQCRDSSCLSTYHKHTFHVAQDSTDGLSANAMPQNYVSEDGSANVPFSWSNVPYLFRTADGMNYGVELDDGNESISVYADVNGNKTPNTVCKDMVKFRISGTGQIANVCGELADGGCSIDHPSACSSSSECWNLNNTNSLDPNGPGNYGAWRNDGHFVSVAWNSNSCYVEFDHCENAKNLEKEGYFDRTSFYCR